MDAQRRKHCTRKASAAYNREAHLHEIQASVVNQKPQSATYPNPTVMSLLYPIVIALPCPPNPTSTN